jgi:pimeloyl-ACP methyl ester carboxylesterase
MPVEGESRIPSNLHIADAGGGQPVLLLHSHGMSGRQWRRLTSELVSRGRRVLVPDLSGHGASPPWPEPTLFSFHTDVAAIVDLLQSIGPADVIGHSYGGLVALQAARAVPGSVRSLSLYDPVAFGVLDGRDRDAKQEVFGLDMSWGPAELDRERWLTTFVDFWSGRGAWTGLRAEAQAEFRRVAWVVREGVRTLLEDSTQATEYASFRFPVRLLTGARSPLPARRVIERLGEALPGSLLAEVPDAGHLGPVTHADAVNRILLEAR